MGEVYSVKGDYIHLAVQVVPGASRSEIKGVRENRLRIRIAAAPEDNKANDELRAFLSGILGCAKKEVVIVSGEKSRIKTLELPSRVEAGLKCFNFFNK